MFSKGCLLFTSRPDLLLSAWTDAFLPMTGSPGAPCLSMVACIIQHIHRKVNLPSRKPACDPVIRCYSSGGVQDAVGNFLRRTALAPPVMPDVASACPHPSRTFKIGIVYDLKRQTVIYLLSFFQRCRRCCYPKSKTPLWGLFPRSTAEKGAYCGGQVNCNFPLPKIY